MAPPGIVAIALGEQAEGVDEAGVDKSLESRALLVGESLLAAIGFRIRQIKLGVRDIQVAAKYDRLGLLQLFAIGEKRRIPMLVPQGEPAQVILGIRRIHSDHEELGELRRDDAALLRAVALQLVGEAESLGEFVRKTIDDLQRFPLGEYRSSRIALLHRRVPILEGIGQLAFDLAAFSLGLLQAQDIGLMRLEKGEKQTLLMHGANAVDVPGINFHCGGTDRQPAPKALYTATSEVAASVRLCDSNNSALSAVRSASSTSRKSMRPPSKRFCARSAALSLAAAATCRESRRVCDLPLRNSGPSGASSAP